MARNQALTAPSSNSREPIPSLITRKSRIEGHIPREGNTKIHLLMTATALAMGLTSPAMAQSSTMHRYAEFFKYSDSAVKAMTEISVRPSSEACLSRSAARWESAYWLPTGGEYDGMVIVQVPDAITEEAISLTVRSTGNFAKNQSIPLMTAEEFKAALEKAKNVQSGYTPPTATKHIGNGSQGNVVPGLNNRAPRFQAPTASPRSLSE
jgi:uncharacterized protein with GYD domain